MVFFVASTDDRRSGSAGDSAFFLFQSGGGRTVLADGPVLARGYSLKALKGSDHGVAAGIAHLKGYGLDGLHGLAPQKAYICSSRFAVWGDQSEIADYAVDSVSYLVSLGMINGNETRGFRPRQPVTRAEMAKLLCLAMEKSRNAAD